MSDSSGDVFDAIVDRQRAHLLRVGFEPGEPVHEWPIDEPDDLMESIRRSLFESSHSRVVPIHLANADQSVRLPVVIVKAEARYDAYSSVPGATPIGAWEVPGWYLEGWVPKSGFDQFDEITRVRILWEDPIVKDTLLWQVNPKDPNTDLPIEVVNW